MISTIMPTGRYVQVSGGGASTYVNNYSGSQGVGNMRYNTSMQCMEVFDGQNWQKINMATASVGLNHEAESLLDWAVINVPKNYSGNHWLKLTPLLK